MASHTDGRSYTTNYTLDHAGRLTLIDFPHDTDVSLTYDAAGRKTEMTEGSSTMAPAMGCRPRAKQFRAV